MNRAKQYERWLKFHEHSALYLSGRATAYARWGLLVESRAHFRSEIYIRRSNSIANARPAFLAT